MVFSLFKKAIHEPVDKQLAEVQEEPVGPLAASGEDCDSVAGAQGPFGQSYNNPVPVNGLLGTYKYFGKLISPKGHIVYFHRLGSLTSDVVENPVDAYELVDLEGRHWDILFVDVYHPRRSNSAPQGFQLKRYDKTLGDIPFAYGVDIYCPDFPYDLPNAIEQRNKLQAFARRVRERVGHGNYDRPETQERKIMMLRGRLTSVGM